MDSIIHLKYALMGIRKLGRRLGIHSKLIFFGFLGVLFTQCQTTTSCSTFLSCLDQTVWVSKNQRQYWKIYNAPEGVYMDVHTLHGNCIGYETSIRAGARFQYQTKINLIENYDGKEWIYTLVNDTVLKKSRTTGGSTVYLFKTTPKVLELVVSSFKPCK